MKQGKLVEVGPCAEVLRKPHHSYTRQLLASLPENLAKPPLGQSLFKNSTRRSCDRPNTTAENLRLEKSGFQSKKATSSYRRLRTCSRRSISGYSARPNRCTGRRIRLWQNHPGAGDTATGKADFRQYSDTRTKLTGLSASRIAAITTENADCISGSESCAEPASADRNTLTEPMKVHRIGANHERAIELASGGAYNSRRDFLWRYLS